MIDTQSYSAAPYDDQNPNPGLDQAYANPRAHQDNEARSPGEASTLPVAADVLPMVSSAMGFHAHVDKGQLVRALTHQNSLIERRSSIPLLTHVLLRAQDGVITLGGTDMEKTLVLQVSAAVYQEGAITVPAHIFYDVVRKMPDGDPIQLRIEQPNRITIQSASIKFDLVTLPAESFPDLYPNPLPFSLKLAAGQLSHLLENTAFCMSTDDLRLSLGGVYFHRHDDQLRAVATDSHRLALNWLIIPEDRLENFPSLIIGSKTIQIIRKLLEENPDQEISFSASNDQMALSFLGCTFSSRLLEGQFPAYLGAIPQPDPEFRTVRLPVKNLANAVSRVGMVNFEKQNVIKLNFLPEKLEISAFSQQYGSALESLPLDYDGPAFCLGFPPRYLLELCQHIVGEFVCLSTKEGVAPILITDPANPCATFVLMPVRIS
jgi:DNA polymerase III subunit beta